LEEERERDRRLAQVQAERAAQAAERAAQAAQPQPSKVNLLEEEGGDETDDAKKNAENFARREAAEQAKRAREEAQRAQEEAESEARERRLTIARDLVGPIRTFLEAQAKEYTALKDTNKQQVSTVMSNIDNPTLNVREVDNLTKVFAVAFTSIKYSQSLQSAQKTRWQETVAANMQANEVEMKDQSIRTLVQSLEITDESEDANSQADKGTDSHADGVGASQAATTADSIANDLWPVCLDLFYFTHGHHSCKARLREQIDGDKEVFEFYVHIARELRDKEKTVFQSLHKIQKGTELQEVLAQRNHFFDKKSRLQANLKSVMTEIDNTCKPKYLNDLFILWDMIDTMPTPVKNRMSSSNMVEWKE